MARYFLRFRHSDTGLTPTFNFFKRASDLATISPPPVGEVGFGTYYFDYSPVADVTFEVDGGSSIPTEEVRYIADTISARDGFFDQPVSTLAGNIAAIKAETDLIGATTDTSGFTIFDKINEIKDKTDALPTDPATATSVTAAVASIKGSGGLSLTDIGGTGFNSSLHSLTAANAVMLRCLGMLHENAVMDIVQFDSVNDVMTNARLRLYDSKANANAAKAASPTAYVTGLLAQYTVSATYTGANLSTYTVVREP